MSERPGRVSFLRACGLAAALAVAVTVVGPALSQPAGQKPGNSPAPPTPSPTPSAPPAEKRPASTPGSETPPADLERLRAEHDVLKDALFRSRARREILENALLSTQLIPVIQWEGARRYLLKNAELRLDGVRIWQAGVAPLGDNPVSLAARGLPPGPHVLGVRLEVRSRENPKLGYTSEQSFSLDLPEGKKTTVEITIDEDGDPPSYDPDIDVEVESR